MLEEAKHHCDYLIVGLQTDPTVDRPESKNAPIQTIVERQIQLAAVKYIDEIVVYTTEQDLTDLLLKKNYKGPNFLISIFTYSLFTFILPYS